MILQDLAPPDPQADRKYDKAAWNKDSTNHMTCATMADGAVKYANPIHHDSRPELSQASEGIELPPATW